MMETKRCNTTTTTTNNNNNTGNWLIRNKTEMLPEPCFFGPQTQFVRDVRTCHIASGCVGKATCVATAGKESVDRKHTASDVSPWTARNIQ